MSNPENLPAVLLFALVQLAAFMLRTWVEPGFLRAQRDVVMTGRGKGVALVGGVDVFVPMLGVRLVNAAVLAVPVLIPLFLLAAGLPTLLASVVLGVGALAAAWVLIGLQFATRLVALGERDALAIHLFPAGPAYPQTHQPAKRKTPAPACPPPPLPGPISAAFSN